MAKMRLSEPTSYRDPYAVQTMSNVIDLFERKAAEPDGHIVPAAKELHMMRATLDKCVYELSKQFAAVERTVDAIENGATRARLKDLATVNRQSLVLFQF